jgi:hypothetical protein
MQLTPTMRAFWCVWDGVQQQVSFFGNEDVPLDVARVLDTSSSMHAVQLAVKSGARALLTMALVVFSDGLDNASHVRFEDGSKLARALRRDDLHDHATRRSAARR